MSGLQPWSGHYAFALAPFRLVLADARGTPLPMAACEDEASRVVLGFLDRLPDGRVAARRAVVLYYVGWKRPQVVHVKITPHVRGESRARRHKPVLAPRRSLLVAEHWHDVASGDGEGGHHPRRYDLEVKRWTGAAVGEVERSTVECWGLRVAWADETAVLRTWAPLVDDGPASAQDDEGLRLMLEVQP